jgi:hypothetical protein
MKPKMTTKQISKQEQRMVLNLFNEIPKDVYAHLDFKREYAELTLWMDDVKEALKVIRPLGIHQLNKKTFSAGESQYAYAETENSHIQVNVYPNNNVFNGCKIIKEEIQVLVKAQPATEEHFETVIKKRVVCGEQ